MNNFVSPLKCVRCAGTGHVPHARDMGRCFKCDGAGMVETDRATIAAKAVAIAGRKALGAAAFAHSTEAHWGLCQLEIREPARLIKAIESFATGDVRVLPALEAYGRSLA